MAPSWGGVLVEEQYRWISFKARRLHLLYDRPGSIFIARELPIDDYWEDFTNLKDGSFKLNQEEEK